MYEAFFRLESRPFPATPDPERWIGNPSAERSLAELERSTRAGRGIGILTAPAGLGKTIACERLVERLSDDFATAFLPNSNFPTRRSLLQALLYELGHPYKRMEEQELRLELDAALRSIRVDRSGALLVIDEAHLLSDRLLEEIRSITNLADGGEPLARVILSGQPLLEERLASPALAALNQRISCQVTLEPLSLQESIDFIAAQIEFAGGDVAEIFTDTALAAIARASDGNPRCISQLSDHSLMLGFVATAMPVDADIVAEALDDLKQLPLHWNQSIAVLEPLEQLEQTARQQREEEFDVRVRPEKSSPRDAQRIKDVESEAIEIGGATFEIGGPEPVTQKSKPAVVEIGGVPEMPTRATVARVDQSTPPARGSSKRRPIDRSQPLAVEVVDDLYARLESQLTAGWQGQPPLEASPTALSSKVKPHVAPKHATAAQPAVDKSVARDERRPDRTLEAVMPLLEEVFDEAEFPEEMGASRDDSIYDIVRPDVETRPAAPLPESVPSPAATGRTTEWERNYRRLFSELRRRQRSA